MAARSVEFWPSLERSFGGIGCALEVGTAVSGSTWCCLFIGDFKKYTVSGVTFSFKLILMLSEYWNMHAAVITLRGCFHGGRKMLALGRS